MNVLIVCAAILLVSSMTGDVQAYLDPGAGSMAIQMVLAVIVGGLAAVKVYWSRIRGWFGGKSRQEKSLLD